MKQTRKKHYFEERKNFHYGTYFVCYYENGKCKNKEQ